MGGLDSWTQLAVGKFGCLEITGSRFSVSRVMWTTPRPMGAKECARGVPKWALHLQNRLSEQMNGDEVHEYKDISLDWTRVSRFSRLVLEACSRIPRGDTRTYGELANEVGIVGAARAVGQVMKRNPFPVVIPCHRVIGSTSNSYFNYTGGGPEMKRNLLSLEGIEFPLVQSRFIF